MAQIDIDKFVISLRRYFGNNKGIATTLDRCLFSLGLKYVDTPTGGRLERVDQPTMLEKIMWGSGEQKPVWSEEDEVVVKDICDKLNRLSMIYVGNESIVCQEDIKWLKFLKDRVQPQPKQEWNEEDEKQYRGAIAICNSLGHTNTADWLKSHRPQSQWKPSEEMLEALYRVIPENTMEISEDEMLLDKLYQGLKYGRVLSNK